MRVAAGDGPTADAHRSLTTEQQQQRGHALLAAMLGMFLDGYDLSIIAVALLPLGNVWHLHATGTGTLMAMALLGSLAGASLGGPLTDRFGRRKLLFPNIFLYIFGAIVSAFSPNLGALCLGRFLIGLAVGMDYPLVATIVAEYSAAERRGNRFAWVNLAWYMGALISSVVGWSLLALGPESWRWMLGSAAIPAILLLRVRRHLPESPRWLSRTGQTDAAQAALAHLQPQWSSEQIAATLRQYQGKRRPWRALLQHPWRRRLVLSALPWFCLDVVGLGIGLYFPVVLRDQGFAASNGAAAAINAAFLVISALGIAFILPRLDRWGRIPLQVAGFSLMTLGLALFAGFMLLHSLPGIYIGCAIYAFGVGIGPGVTVFALAVEIFPTELRASAAGIATAVSRLGAALSAALFPVLERFLGLPAVLVMMALVSAAGAAVTVRYAVESRQKTLESLENTG